MAKDNPVLSISSACNQSWNDMQASESGRYCFNCQKAVYDFSESSPHEILNVLASSQKICGRFKEEQLTDVNRLLQQQLPKRFAWPRYASILLLLSGLLSSIKGNAKARPTITSAIEKVVYKPGSIQKESVQQQVEVKGIITTEGDNRPVPGAVVRCGNIRTITDTAGNFAIKLPATTKELSVVYIGYETYNLKLDLAKQTFYEVALKISNSVMGEVSVIGAFPSKTQPKKN